MNVPNGRTYDLLMRLPIAGLTLYFLARELEGLPGLSRPRPAV